jgi:LPS-assembly lipoprotein
MSLSDRRAFLLLPLALAACGFTPVYAPGGTASALRGRVRVKAPEDRNAYLLVQELEQQLGRATAPAYDLTFDVTTVAEGQAVTAEGDITRYSLLGQVKYELRPTGSDQVVATGSVDNFTGYSATGTTVEALAAERDAQERLMKILADQVVTRLYATAALPA